MLEAGRLSSKYPQLSMHTSILEIRKQLNKNFNTTTDLFEKTVHTYCLVQTRLSFGG